MTSWVPGAWSGAGLGTTGKVDLRIQEGEGTTLLLLQTPSDTSFQFQSITIFSFLKMPCKIESCKQV